MGHVTATSEENIYYNGKIMRLEDVKEATRIAKNIDYESKKNWTETLRK